MIKEAVILAGGFGTRLQSIINDVPKPMAPINDIPFLNYILKYLKFYNIEHVVFSVGYLSNKIKEYYKNEFHGISISYAEETTPLGTGGGIRLSLQQCDTQNCLVLNGDSFFDVNLISFYNQFVKTQSDCILALRKIENAARYGTIKLNDSKQIIEFKEKDGNEISGLINGGVYILNRNIFLENTPADISFSIEKDFFETKLTDINVTGVEYPNYFIDIGIPADYEKAQHEFKKFKY